MPEKPGISNSCIGMVIKSQRMKRNPKKVLRSTCKHTCLFARKSWQKQKTPWCWISIQHASGIATIYTWMPRVQMSLFGFLKRLRTRSWASQSPGSKHYLSSNARQVAGVPRSKAANRMWDLKASRWFVRPGEERCDRNHPKKTLKYSRWSGETFWDTVNTSIHI